MPIFSELLTLHLRNLAKKTGRDEISIAQLSEAIRVNRSTVWHWLEGDTARPKCDSVLRCAQFLRLNNEEKRNFLAAAGCPYDPLQPDTPNTLQPITTAPISRPMDFFGRERLLEEVFAAWDRPVFEHVAIIGDKRSGKTSLLNYLQHIHTATELREEQRWRWAGSDYQWVYVDFRYAGTMAQEKLLRHILAELGLRVPEICDLERFVEIIEDQLNRPVVILMDDVEFGLEAAAFDQRFWNTLRHLASNPVGKRIGFCVTSRRNPAALEARAAELGKPSPFFNTFDSKPLEPLTQDEAAVFFERMGIGSEDGAWLMENLGTWPVVLQNGCKIRLGALQYGEEDWRERCLALRDDYAYLSAPPQ